MFKINHEKFGFTKMKPNNKQQQLRRNVYNNNNNTRDWKRGDHNSKQKQKHNNKT